MEKGWTSARLAAPANSVRTADEQLCDVGVAGLSLRDITCKSVDASRHRKIASIKVVLENCVATKSRSWYSQLPTVVIST